MHLQMPSPFHCHRCRPSSVNNFMKESMLVMEIERPFRKCQSIKSILPKNVHPTMWAGKWQPNGNKLVETKMPNITHSAPNSANLGPPALPSSYPFRPSRCASRAKVSKCFGPALMGRVERQRRQSLSHGIFFLNWIGLIKILFLLPSLLISREKKTKNFPKGILQKGILRGFDGFCWTFKFKSHIHFIHSRINKSCCNIIYHQQAFENKRALY